MSQAPAESTVSMESATRIRFLVLGGGCLLAMITYLHRRGFRRSRRKWLINFNWAVARTATSRRRS